MGSYGAPTLKFTVLLGTDMKVLAVLAYQQFE